ncbi:MAG: bifunctional (p)ppGpp synthetase/guanosine-3',5'-bis(diphosphate) 3'-pyrophosphohydrolase [Cardiobacteriaceae bacterium]|nr:bifunctional (p)ppGpp synthetase/guanosine-3',5'-bis(diphosphate) 3'-pyrophosphohydrolase [Cardiobacteriaceae bacterium]
MSSNPFEQFAGSQFLLDAWNELHEEVAAYLNPDEIEILLTTAVYGADKHSGQSRESGEPYFTHPIAVAKILAEQKFDLAILQAGLLHDVLEDTPVTKQEMAEQFGVAVTALVDGVSKLERLKDQAPQEALANTFHKMLVAATDDPCVIIIKLADRLHNMRTLGALRPDKRIRKARETMEVYAPIASRLGMFYFFAELQDLAFANLFPWRYRIIKKHYAEKFGNNEMINRVIAEIDQVLIEKNINAKVAQRRRSLWNIYGRMKNKGGFNAACRTITLRIITEQLDDCYRALGAVHNRYRPVEGKFEDYIASPKSNGYRSLRTSVTTNRGEVLNVHIRTKEMHILSENGVIAVWHQNFKNQIVRNAERNKVATKNLREWLSSLRDIEYITENPLEFYDAIKKEINPHGSIQVYSPQGKVIDLPRGATPVDFAYYIHTDLGNCCRAALVNGNSYPLSRALQTGQTVKIITNKTPCAQIGWLQFVVSARARIGIRHCLANLQGENAANLGKDLLNQALHAYNIDFASLENSEKLQNYLDKNRSNINTLLSDIAAGRRQPILVAAAILGKTETAPQVLYINSATDAGILIADCCYPLPNEQLAAYLETGKGIHIHRKNCNALPISNTINWICAEWSDNIQGNFKSMLSLEVLNRPMILANIASNIAAENCNIADISLDSNGQENSCKINLILEVKDRDHLAKIVRRIRPLDGIISINR